jgi:predicted outer membrane repeat protein
MVDIFQDVQVDAIHNGLAYGSVAQRLLNNGMNIGILRPYQDDGKSWIIVNEMVHGEIVKVPKMVANALLTYDEWKQIDRTVKEISKLRMVGTRDLVSRGLTYNITDGLGTTVLQWQASSDVSDAEVDMAGESQATEDRTAFGQNYLPLPIIHKAFRMNIRFLAMGRKLQNPLDTFEATAATRKVSEKIESILFTGNSSYTFGGGTIYGYQDFPQRNTVALATHWDASAATGAGILSDVIAMKQASIDARHYGPWALYVPTGYETQLDEDYATNYGKSIRARILEISGIEAVNVSDYLTAHNIVMVEMSPETVQMVIGMEPTPVQWDEQGGMVSHHKVMAIMVPRLMADKDGNCGIVHMS